MKERAWVVSLVLSVWVGMAVSSWGHVPAGVMYYAVQLPDGHLPVLDGDLSDWDIVPEPYVMRTEDLYDLYSGMGKEGGGVNLRDFAVRVIVGWNDTTNRLYFMAEVFDDMHVVVPGPTKTSWFGDGWHFVIDADHSGGRWSFGDLLHYGAISEEENKRLSGSHASSYGLVEPPVQGLEFVSASYSTWMEERGEFFDVGWSSTGDPFGESTYYYELFIYPFDDLNWVGPEVSKRHDLKEGEIIGLRYSFADSDHGTDPHDGHPVPEAGWGTAQSVLDVWDLGDFYLCPVDPVFAKLGSATVTAVFSASDVEGEMPFTVQFTDESTGDATYYVWDFGDGAKSTERNPEHTYRFPGVYTVTLEVMGPGGVGREEKEGYITVRGLISEIGIWVPRVPALPGERIRVPVLVDDLTDLGVVSLELLVAYDGEWLEVLGMETEGTLLEDAGEEGIRYEMSPGNIEVAMSPEDALVGEGVLVFLELKVSSSVEAGNVSRMRLAELRVNGTLARCEEEGEVAVTMVGDVSYDHQVTEYDAGLVVLASVGVIPLPDPDYPNLRVDVGDVDGDGDMDEVDAALMMQYEGGLLLPTELPLPDVEASVGLGEIERREEEILVVPVLASELQDVLAGRILLDLEGGNGPAQVLAGEGIKGYTFGYRMDGDRVEIAFAGREASSGAGSIAEFQFSAREGETGRIRLKQVRLNGQGARIAQEELDISDMPGTYWVYPNYPNPFNLETIIEFDLAESGEVKLGIWNVAGRPVRKLVKKHLPVGRHKVVWDGRDDAGREVGSGVYAYRLRADGWSQVRKMILIR